MRKAIKNRFKVKLFIYSLFLNIYLFLVLLSFVFKLGSQVEIIEEGQRFCQSQVNCSHLLING